jgi:hypothetical protein
MLSERYPRRRTTAAVSRNTVLLVDMDPQMPFRHGPGITTLVAPGHLSATGRGGRRRGDHPHPGPSVLAHRLGGRHTRMPLRRPAPDRRLPHRLHGRALLVKDPCGNTAARSRAVRGHPRRSPGPDRCVPGPPRKLPAATGPAPMEDVAEDLGEFDLLPDTSRPDLHGPRKLPGNLPQPTRVPCP